MFIVETIIKNAGKKGIGVFATSNIRKGQLIWKFDENFKLCWSEKKFNKLHPIAQAYIRKHGAKESHNMWYLDIDNTKYINHSSSPNLLFVSSKNKSDYGDIMSGVALCNIKKGEEITCDYYCTSVNSKDGYRDIRFKTLQ